MSKSLYPELFAVIGYTYGGSGNGFCVPDLTDGKFLQYGTTMDAGKVIEAGLPDITGHFRTEAQLHGATGGAWVGGAFRNERAGTYHLECPVGGSNWTGVSFSASRSNKIYGNSKTVQPFSMTVIPIIKVK